MYFILGFLDSLWPHSVSLKMLMMGIVVTTLKSDVVYWIYILFLFPHPRRQVCVRSDCSHMKSYMTICKGGCDLFWQDPNVEN